MQLRSKLNIPERKLIMVFGDFIIISCTIYFYLNYVIDYDFLSISAVLTISGLGILIYFFLSYVLDFYYLRSSSIASTRTIMKGIIIAAIFSFSIVLLSVLFFDASFWRINLVIFFFISPILLFLWRKIFFFIFKFIPTTKKVFFLHEHETLKINTIENKIKIIDGLDLETHYIVSHIHDLKRSLKVDNIQLGDINKDVDTWVIDVDLSKRLPKNIEKYMLNALVDGKEVLTFTSFYENVYEALPIISHNANESCAEILQLQHNKVRYLSLVFSFTVNFFLAAFVGIILLLVIPFVFTFNLIFNKGPLFYIQKRIGQFGKEFNIYKFRSMVVDAEKSGAKMATKNDARITPFGKTLRMFRIDELPQIISVIKGDMLFIGPRPERKIFVDELNEILPYYDVRHLVKPGITGWAQVKYKYGENLEDSIKKLEYDLYYIKKKSITLDLRIIFKTFTTIIFSRGV